MKTEIKPIKVDVCVTVGEGEFATTHSQVVNKIYYDNVPKWMFAYESLIIPTEPKNRLEYLLAHVEMCKAVINMKTD